MTSQNTALIRTDDLIAIIGAAAKHRTALRNEMREAQEAGDLRKRNDLAKVYHPLSDKLKRLAQVYVESL